MSTPRPLNRPWTSEDYVAMLRRKWRLIVGLALLGPIIGYGISRLLPTRYTSTSLILIERQQVPETYVKPVITDDLNARVADLQQQVLSRTRLLPIIDRFGLFKDRAPHASTEELMEMMLKAVALTAVKPIIAGGNEVLPGFRVEVTLGDPQKAQQVCHEIVSMFVSENIRQRENSAQGTVSFLQNQLDEAKRKLDERCQTRRIQAPTYGNASGRGANEPQLIGYFEYATRIGQPKPESRATRQGLLGVGT